MYYGKSEVDIQDLNIFEPVWTASQVVIAEPNVLEKHGQEDGFTKFLIYHHPMI